MSSKGVDAAVFIKEDIESNNYDYIYYGGGLASEEYGAVIVDVSGDTQAVVQEHAYESVGSSGDFHKVLSTRQSISQLVSHVLELTGKYRQKSVLVDGASLTANTAALMAKAGFVPERSLTEFVYSQRSQKSAYEIGEIEKAIKIGKEALRMTVDKLKVGNTVADVTLLLKKSMLDGGAVSESFATGVKIRKGVTEREASRLERGSLVIFDFGARLESNYLNDMGRTIIFGPTDPLRDFMNDVYGIKKAGLREIRAGVTGNDVRKRIDEAIGELGYASVHRPGHQIGLNVHEPYQPDLAYGEENRIPLQDRNVVTWEPGIGPKDENSGRVRSGLAHLEDMVLVSSDSTMLGNVPLEFA